MKAERIARDRYQLQLEANELHVIQFVTKFVLALDSSVFRGKFMRRLRRIHEALEVIQ